ncbi:hypothetical protein A3709_15325 [Halioglobus sp. HI00S01]|uniref:efflux RND transporter periplasmic adaptor subunit n=1 Tax=Halioglobus sp. HI00S01 TaxID=1822214 RepID=UPI0007C27470|nr:efflux RND transporter periplasmic adaptor subunit [Halioglobus sp. HI00S01]KZX58934.1 hypothetical protein A3709_15325 [Halioglobus sp. HI00S01]
MRITNKHGRQMNNSCLCSGTIRLITVCLTALLAACGADETATSNTPDATEVTVRTVTLQPTTWQGNVASFGVIEALEEVSIAAELSGTVKAVYVDEGDEVSVGQLLLELDPRKSELALTQASKALEEAKAQLDDASQKLARRSNLAASNTISVEALDSAKVALDSASARYQRAVAAHELAQRHLEDTRIYSPANGQVDIQAVESGEPVRAGETLVTLQLSGGLRMQTWVSETDVLLLYAGNAATIIASALPGQSYPATIEWLGVAADKNTGNYPVKLLLNSPDAQLRPGMTATATMQTRPVDDVLILPEQALVDRARRKVVFVVEEGVARMREPVLATGLANHLQILAGLAPNEEVIVDGHAFVVEGAAITALQR